MITQSQPHNLTPLTLPHSETYKTRAYKKNKTYAPYKKKSFGRYGTGANQAEGCKDEEENTKGIDGNGNEVLIIAHAAALIVKVYI